MRIKANFCDGHLDGDKLLFFDNEIQAVCYMDILSGRMKIVKSYESDMDFIARFVVGYDDKLYFCTESNTNLLVYDISRETFEMRIFEQDKEASLNTVSKIFIFNGVIWMTPYSLEDKIICYDIVKDAFYSVDNLVELMRKTEGNLDVFSPFYQVEGIYLWTAVYGSNSYVKYNLIKKRSEVHELPDKELRLNGIWVKDGKKWFSGMKTRNVYCMNQNYDFKEFDCGGARSRAYSSFVEFEDKIYLLPRLGNEMIEMDANSDEMKVYELKYEKDINEIYPEATRNVKIYERSMFIFPYNTDKLLRFHFDSKDTQEVEIFFDDDYDTIRLERYRKRNQVINETKDMNFETFIKLCNL